MRFPATLAMTFALAATLPAHARPVRQRPAPHNVILFVVDGLRGRIGVVSFGIAAFPSMHSYLGAEGSWD